MLRPHFFLDTYEFYSKYARFGRKSDGKKNANGLSSLPSLYIKKEQFFEDQRIFFSISLKQKF